MAFPTTFDTLKDAVFAKLRLQDDATNRARVSDWINQVYAHVCIETECLIDRGTVALTPNESSYVLDSDVLRIKQLVAAPTSTGTYGAPLVSASLDEILEYRQSYGTAQSNSYPSRYALLGLNRLELWPTPTTADTLAFYYVKLPTALNADGDVPELQEPWPKVIEHGALYEAAVLLKDPDVLLYRDDYERWLIRFRAHLNKREGGPTSQFRVVGAAGVVVGDRSADVW